MTSLHTSLQLPQSSHPCRAWLPADAWDLQGHPRASRPLGADRVQGPKRHSLDDPFQAPKRACISHWGLPSDFPELGIQIGFISSPPKHSPQVQTEGLFPRLGTGNQINKADTGRGAYRSKGEKELSGFPVVPQSLLQVPRPLALRDIPPTPKQVLLVTYSNPRGITPTRMLLDFVDYRINCTNKL